MLNIQSKSWYKKIPQKLISQLSSWDISLYNHSAMAAVYAEYIADELDVKLKNHMIIGAFLHDIGKCSLPQNINYKKLTSADWENIKNHPLIGAEITEKIWPTVPLEVLRIIYQHHERPDGSGYPDGISIKEIDEQALIVSTLEVYVALREYRPYRVRDFTHKQAIEKLREFSFPEKIINILDKENGNLISRGVKLRAI